LGRRTEPDGEPVGLGARGLAGSSTTGHGKASAAEPSLSAAENCNPLELLNKSRGPLQEKTCYFLSGRIQVGRAQPVRYRWPGWRGRTSGPCKPGSVL